MSTIYSQLTQNNYSNFNDGTVANRNYAWEFVPTGSFIPTNITLYAEGVVGTATGEIYLRAGKTFGSTQYAAATGLTFTSAANSIALSSGVILLASTTYFVYFRATSNSSNYPQWQYNTGASGLQMWRPTASNVDPTDAWFTYPVKMLIEGIDPVTFKPVIMQF